MTGRANQLSRIFFFFFFLRRIQWEFNKPLGPDISVSRRGEKKNLPFTFHHPESLSVDYNKLNMSEIVSCCSSFRLCGRLKIILHTSAGLQQMSLNVKSQVMSEKSHFTTTASTSTSSVPLDNKEETPVSGLHSADLLPRRNDSGILTQTGWKSHSEDTAKTLYYKPEQFPSLCAQLRNWWG